MRLNPVPGQTGQAVRRYERSAPGELVVLDIEKPAKIHRGGRRAHYRRGPSPAATAAVAAPACTSPSTITPGPPCVEAHDDETAAWTRTGAGDGQTLPVSGFVVRYPVTTALGDPPARAAPEFAKLSRGSADGCQTQIS